MSPEIELKLAVTPKAFHELSEHLKQFNILEQKTIFLGNTYYDFPDHFLAKQKMGLRIRQENNDFTLTLKTDGQVIGGLHSRPEYNLAIPNDDVPTNEQLQRLYPFETLPNSRLQPIFSTDFNRTYWLVEFEGSNIEVAFDEGKIEAQGKTQPICEIEFELKSGETENLLRFVKLLPFTDEIYFSAASKAKRGYQLGSKQLLTDWIEQWRHFQQKERDERAVDFQAKFNAVIKMEQQLIEETLAFPAEAFSLDFMKTVERVGAFFNLYHYYDDNKASLEKGHANLLINNQQLRNEIKDLIRFHSETKDNLKTIEKLTALLKSRLYFDRMIGLMELVI